MSPRRKHAGGWPATALTALVALSAACPGTEVPEGLAPSPAGDGPVVVFDLFARPLPEVPIPNDIAMRPDPTSPTGRRVNVSHDASTQMEVEIRELLDQLDGWATYGSITVSFEPTDQTLDLDNILRRHRDDAHRFADDVLYVINVDRDSPNFGHVTAVDLGGGSFPWVLESRDRYYENDPRANTSNLMTDTVSEDTNGNGVLDVCEDVDHDGEADPGEDLDGDGVVFSAERDEDGDGQLDPEEDLNGNGRLDCSEDTDFDGVLDVPNLWCGRGADGRPIPPQECPDVVVETPQGEVVREAQDHWLTEFYERETNTLIIRPMIPLDERTTYAVVVTNRLVDIDGRPVRSPFPSFHHVDQTRALEPLGEILAADSETFGGLELDDVAFAWTFTTQSVTSDVHDLREGLYGRGPFAELAEEFPPDLRVDPAYECWLPGCELPDNVFIVPMNSGDGRTGFVEVLRPFASEAFGIDGEEYNALADTLTYVDYMMGVRYQAPNFLDNDGESEDVDGDGELDFVDEDLDGDGELDPEEDVDYDGHLDVFEDLDGDGLFRGEEGHWDIDAANGRWGHGAHQVTALITVPRADPERGIVPPFPVVFYVHGYTSSRIEMMGFAGSLARYGFATIGVDAVHHGNAIDAELEDMVRTVTQLQNLGGLGEHIIHDRARDLNGDGTPDSGADFWVGDVFQLRDMVRQTGVDMLQLIRILRSFDGERLGFDVDGDGEVEVAGDFNGDGEVDVGGPDGEFYVMGSSLGGIMSAFLAGLEPSIVAAAPSAGGGGLTDVGIRSRQGGVREAVILRAMGPLLMTGPASAWYDLRGCSDENPCEGGGACVDGVCRCASDDDCGGDDICSEARADLASDEPVCARRRDTACGINDVSAYFIVPDLNDTARVEYACIDRGDLGEGDTIVARNLVNGESGCFVAWPEGRSRIHLASDLLDSVSLEVYDGEVLLDGDGCVLRADSEPHLVIDTFGVDATFQTYTWSAGAPLVAPAEGLGLRRATPAFRRFFGIAQTVAEPADPANMARHYFEAPVDYGPETGAANVMVVASIGDMNVPINTGVAIARAAGILDIFRPDPRLADAAHPEGRTANQFLLDNEVILGLERLSTFRRESDGRQVLYDPDDFDRSGSPPTPGWDGDGQGAPAPAVPLRAWRRRVETDVCTCRDASGEHECLWPGDTVGPLDMVRCPGGVSVLSMPYIEPTGTHGINIPEPTRHFDIHTFAINQIGYYFSTGGTEVRWDLCMEDSTCTVEEQGFLTPPVPAP